MAEQLDGVHGERGRGCCCGPLVDHDGDGFTSDGFGGGTAERFVPYLSV
jgi:hypothetical protein